MSERIPAHGSHIPEEYRSDLYPDAGRDENVAAEQAEPQDYATAHEVKDLHRRLSQLGDDELKRITLVPAGTRLRQGATYIDLAQDEPAEFTATAEQVAAEHQRIVAKDDVDYELWNVLLDREERPPQRNA